MQQKMKRINIKKTIIRLIKNIEYIKLIFSIKTKEGEYPSFYVLNLVH